jgi:hypothetical protein
MPEKMAAGAQTGTLAITDNTSAGTDVRLSGTGK